MKEGIHVIEGQVDAEVAAIVDRLGYESAKAQKLNDPITSVRRLGSDKIYLLVTEGNGQGLLRVGRRKLFVTSSDGGELVACNPLCVLDFYVRDRRKGCGSMLMNYMLSAEKVDIPSLAFDRPSAQLKSFLRSRFHISNLTVQANKFAIILPDFHSTK